MIILSKHKVYWEYQTNHLLENTSTLGDSANFGFVKNSTDLFTGTILKGRKKRKLKVTYARHDVRLWRRFVGDSERLICTGETDNVDTDERRLFLLCDVVERRPPSMTSARKVLPVSTYYSRAKHVWIRENECIIISLRFLRKAFVFERNK